MTTPRNEAASTSGSTRGDIPPDLAALADAYGVATGYDDWANRPVSVSAETVRRTLAALGVDTEDPAAALADAQLRDWRRVLAPAVVVRQGQSEPVVAHLPADAPVVAAVLLEDGGERPLETGKPTERREVDGVQRAGVPLVLPPDLPLGWHRLQVAAGGEQGGAVLVVAPRRVELPADLARQWGWMVQLYSMRSESSWGLGDYADLAELGRWSGERGAGLVLCNPLHAPAPVCPVEPSPYSPSSRRFRSPLYLRIEDTPEYAGASDDIRQRVDALAAGRRADNRSPRIDRDPVWTDKLAALELLWPWARTKAVEDYRAEQRQGLEDFAVWCVLAQAHGVPWQDWPAELHHPEGSAVAEVRREQADRVTFFCWLQLLCDEQLGAAQRTATEAGMPIGIVHDLAVGVDAGGADGWGLQDALAMTTTVGAPPDSFNQRGQDWALPPWRPDRLAELGYAPFRDMVRGVLRHAGGIRIDHVMGLFRLWWVPAGASPAEGTYVRYDADALLGILVLEATRAGALIVGEDLGTVEPRVTRALADNGVLGSAVLWFERAEDPQTGEDAGPLPPARWRELALASVTTHDLPTAAGWWTGEQVRVRAELGQLGHSVEEEQARVDTEHREIVGMLIEAGLLPAEDGGGAPSTEQIVVALHRALVASPSRLVLAALGDAVGDLRQPNLPGTTDEYPNWRLPIAEPDPAGGEPHPMLLADLQTDPRVDRLVALLARVNEAAATR